MFKKYAEIYGEIWNKSFETSAEILKKSGEIWENVVSNEDFAKHCLATLESVSNATKPAEWLETTLLGRPVQVGQTPYEIVWREGTASLRFYQSSTPKDKKPLFIVYAMVNRPYILDLISDRSVIQKILNSGRDVYLLDWGEPTQNESELPLSYFTHYLINSAVDAVLTRENIDSLPLLGYCQGGTFSLLYALKEEQKISSLTLMATPVDFSKMGLLSLWAKHLDPSIFLNEKGNVDGWRLRMAFENLRPFHLPLRWQGFGKKILEGDIGEVEKEHFAAMEKWINDDRDIPGKA
ncbi:MAG: alpha/beta fold hydrolase, partial [Planctomycetota bacterium]